MSQYTVTLADSTTIVRARKDAAIKAGESSGQEFTVASKSGAIVYKTENAERPGQQTTTEAPAPEATTEEENTVTEQATETESKTTTRKPTGTAVAISAGSKAQASAFGASGVALAEQMGLTATVSVGEKAVYVEGNKTEVKRFQKEADKMWAAQAEALKGWKKENKDARREQFQTPDGQRQMLKDELAFITTAGENHLSAADVL